MRADRIGLGIVASARARCTSVRSSDPAARYTAERTRGCRKATPGRNATRPFDSAPTRPTAGSRTCRLHATRARDPRLDRSPRRGPAYGLARQGSDSPHEALLDPGVEGRCRRHAEAAREFAVVRPRGNSISARGLPRVSTISRSSTWSSNGADKTDSRSARASRRPRDSTWTSGSPRSAWPISRAANTIATARPRGGEPRTRVPGRRCGPTTGRRR